MEPAAGIDDLDISPSTYPVLMYHSRESVVTVHLIDDMTPHDNTYLPSIETVRQSRTGLRLPYEFTGLCNGLPIPC